MHFNAITLVGIAATDPEIVFFESGSVRARIEILVDNEKTDAVPPAANPFDQESWPRLRAQVETWGKRAQLLADSVRSGQSFGVSGRLLLAGSGTPRVLADHITFP